MSDFSRQLSSQLKWLKTGSIRVFEERNVIKQLTSCAGGSWVVNLLTQTPTLKGVQTLCSRLHGPVRSTTFVAALFEALLKLKAVTQFSDDQSAVKQLLTPPRCSLASALVVRCAIHHNHKEEESASSKPLTKNLHARSDGSSFQPMC